MDNWSFNESYIWRNYYPECSNDKQSPINIDTELIKYCKTLCKFDTIYKSSNCYVNYNNNLIRIKYDTGSYLKYQDVLYELSEITIHTPSLHSIDGEKYDCEICMIHKLSDNSSDINGIILSRLFQRGPHHGKPEQFLNQIINEIPLESIDYDKQISVSNDWGANMLIPKNKSFFMYDGSLPFPPCNEKYKVLVYEDIGTLGSTNIETLKINIGNNNRPIQNLNNRDIFYTAITGPEKKEFTSETSKNRYLKCEKKEILGQTTTTKPVKTTEAVSKDYGLSQDVLDRLKQLVLVVIVVLLMATSYLFIKYLFKHFYLQRLLKAIAGNKIINDSVWKEWKDCNKTSFKGKVGQEAKQAPGMGQGMGMGMGGRM